MTLAFFCLGFVGKIRKELRGETTAGRPRRELPTSLRKSQTGEPVPMTLRALSAAMLALTVGCVTAGYKEVAGWPGWKCADAPGEPGQSLWYETPPGQKGAV